MAKFHGFIKGDMKGNAGQLSFRQQDGMTIVSGRIYNNKSAGYGASYAQREQRIRLAGLVNLYKALAAFEKKAWEGKPARVSDYNMFVKKNLSAANVYFTKEQASMGACYPMRCLVAQGTMSPIALTWITENIVSDIALGEFVVESQAKVGDLSAAIIDNNYGYKQGDKITFGLCRIVWLQVGETRFPSVQTEYIELTLDTASEALVGEVCSSAHASFSNADGKLTITAVGDACVIVHTREMDNKLLCSTQNMVLQVRSGATQPYSTDEAKEAAAQSYGYQPTVLIQPGEYAGGGDTPTPTPTSRKLTFRIDTQGGVSGYSAEIHKDNAQGELIATVNDNASHDYTVDNGQVVYIKVNGGTGMCSEWYINGEGGVEMQDTKTFTVSGRDFSVSCLIANI